MPPLKMNKNKKGLQAASSYTVYSPLCNKFKLILVFKLILFHSVWKFRVTTKLKPKAC